MFKGRGYGKITHGDSREVAPSPSRNPNATTQYDLPKEVYGAIRVIKDWQPNGKWNQRMRRKALKALLRITIYGTRSRE